MKGSYFHKTAPLSREQVDAIVAEAVKKGEVKINRTERVSKKKPYMRKRNTGG